LAWIAPLSLGGLAFLAVVGGPEHELRADGASGDSPNDPDGDGLCNLLESGLGISPDLVDTDGDGWNDAEEIARHSLPHIFSSVPTNNTASLGLTAWMNQSLLHVSAAVYLREVPLASSALEFGLYAGGRWMPLTTAHYGSSLSLTTVPTNTPGQTLLVVSAVLPKFPMTRTGAMSIFAKLRVNGTVIAASAIDLVLRQQVPMLVMTPSQVSPLAQTELGTGLLYRPLGGTQIPSTWTSGEICFQRLESVGTHGAVVTQEVTSANCISGWDGYCDGGTCSSSVGTTVDLVDPGALVGG
jgi:hypothetical protein